MTRASGDRARRAGRRIRDLAARWWRALDSMGPLIDIRVGITTAEPGRPLPRHGQLVTDGDVLRALARLREASGWERLEISRDPVTGAYGGYCLPPAGRSIEIADILAGPEFPEVILELKALLDDSGWQRLEALSDRRGGTGGYCERANGSGVRWPALHERDVMKLSSIDHPGAVIHVAGPVQEPPPPIG